MERDTRGLNLTDSERFNYYPASPMAGISWTFAGTLHLVDERGPTSNPTLGPELPRLLFSGPQSRPTASWAPGPVHALLVGFYPESLERLLKIRIKDYVDQILPLSDLASPDFLAACSTVFQSDEGIPAYNRVEKLFEVDSAFGTLGGPETSLGRWLRSLTSRAALSTAGRGLRQFQRRINHWTGQSHRDLQLYSRVEDAFIRRQDHRTGHTVDLASLALDSGYADQSHMGREIRRVTGLSPAKLEELIASDESFWYYRLVDDWSRTHRS